ALGMARQRQRPGVKNQRALTNSREDAIHLNGLERMTTRKHFFELRPQRGKFKGAVPEFTKWDTLRLIARDPEHCVEGAIARLDLVVSAQHDERFGDRVEDRLGAFAFVDGLIDACAESSHISERQHGAGDLTIASYIRGYPNNEPLVSIAKIGPGFCSA